MKYIKMKIIEVELRIPKIIYLEVTDDGVELRKVQFYLDGTVGFASEELEYERTRLSGQYLPSVEELNEACYFIASYTTPHEFEQLWRKYVTNRI
ncbi:DUF6881 domain-containing protein [Paenibacillus sp. SYP-B4298]|uniref:DUF6881 domain-containing protein n=1 Tax=Paenibacillus sp. SYP-B4298 TaxID=2996034 RepID=UPI0022DCEDCA|nr:hypothetical protein [Paenibacillus sp. SYP-B4298]